jgi:hypothetical protein
VIDHGKMIEDEDEDDVLGTGTETGTGTGTGGDPPEVASNYGTSFLIVHREQVNLMTWTDN